MSRVSTMARRGFLIGSAAVVGGVAFGAYRYQQPLPNPLKAGLPQGRSAITPYVVIDQQGVTVIAPRAEMGQGVHTTLAALVAEELDLPWDSLRVEHGPPAAAYFNSAGLVEGVPFSPHDHGFAAEAMRGTMAVMARFMAMQFTGGSSTMADAFEKMRQAGATARWALVQAAAAQWGMAAEQLKTAGGAVVAPDGRRLAYTAIAVEAAKLTVPEVVPLKPRATWSLLGRSLPRVDMRAKTTGAAVYAIDVTAPEMLFAAVRRNPALDAPLKRIDARDALSMRGVSKVVELPGGVAVIADNTWRAMQAVNAVRCEWGEPVHPASTAAVWETIIAAFDDKHRDSRLRDDGDVDQALQDGDVLTAEYRAPFLAHAPMEPPTAMAQLKDGRLHIWAGTQMPTLVRDQMAKVAGVNPSEVELHVTLMGGSFGRRLESDFVEQAVRLAMAVPGQPVKLTWSREEDLTQDAYRPAAAARLRGKTAAGRALALDVHVCSLSVIASQGARAGMTMPGPDKLIADGTYEQPYGIPNCRATANRAPASIPVSSWRSVGNSYNGFFMEGFIDEMAHQAGVDPLAFRLSMVSEASARKVLETARDLSGWSKPLPKGHGRGVALHLAFGVPVAEVVELVQTEGGIRVLRVCVVADVGTALDPRNIESQLQGAVIFGLSAAIYGEITFSDGAVEQKNFNRFESLRMAQAPRVDVTVLALGGPIRGIGEPGVPPAAPALANAIFSATGKRIRELPLRKHISFA